MCQTYKEVYQDCGHMGQVQAASLCAISLGISCPNKTTGPVRTVSGKCTNCRRKYEQAKRLFGNNANLMSETDVLLEGIRAAVKH